MSCRGRANARHDSTLTGELDGGAPPPCATTVHRAVVPRPVPWKETQRMSPDDGRMRRRPRLPRMVGRDPSEHDRVASPLELLFDLTFVIAVGVSASGLAELLAEGHVWRAILAFTLAMFAVLVAWINFTWFASAFDTDDWAYRLLTMLQMVGVVVFALGLPTMFRSVDDGGLLDLRIMVVGYVVMRVGLLLQWARAGWQSTRYRGVASRTIVAIALVQVGWVLIAFLRPPTPVIVSTILLLGAVEFLVPVFGQGRANGTPWHPHHIADRYGAFALIVLGEGVVGTVATSQGVLGSGAADRWSWEVVLVVVAGVALTFGMWWSYFLTPFGELLAHRGRRGYLFGYGHVPIFMAIAATGAGLHLAGIYLSSSPDHRGPEYGVVLAVAIPVLIFVLGLYSLYRALFSSHDTLHFWLILATVVVLVVATGLGFAGVSMPICLVVVGVAPFVTVVGFETAGGRANMAADLETIRAADADAPVASGSADRTSAAREPGPTP
jgi:low temperature requirement protein LtrA